MIFFVIQWLWTRLHGCHVNQESHTTQKLILKNWITKSSRFCIHPSLFCLFSAATAELQLPFPRYRRKEERSMNLIEKLLILWLNLHQSEVKITKIKKSPSVIEYVLVLWPNSAMSKAILKPKGWLSRFSDHMANLWLKQVGTIFLGQR